VALISILFVRVSVANELEGTFISLIWVAIVILPLVTTVGVFITYRGTYMTRPSGSTTGALRHQRSQEEQQWERVINKALDWNRFLMPLAILNMFITLVGGFFLYADIAISGDIHFGAYTMSLVFATNIEDMTLTALNTIGVPSSIFYLGLLGFFVQFLEMTRRRYVSRNLVPRFYLTSAFRLVHVCVTVVVIYLFLTILFGNPSRELVLVSAFVVGMFPLQLLAPVVDFVRQRMGVSAPRELSLMLIDGIDNTLESLLQEENIDSVQMLATTEAEEIHKRTAIPVRTLQSWQRQARLFHALGTEDLIHRFARIGINDFDDLGVLEANFGEQGIDGPAFSADFTSAMKIKADDEAISTEAFWKVLVQVLIREYRAEKAGSPSETDDQAHQDEVEPA
jgi:hypothetical protein